MRLPSTIAVSLALSGCAFEVENIATPTVELLEPTADQRIVVAEAFAIVAAVHDDGDDLADVTVRMRSDVDGELCVRTPGVTGRVECTVALTVGAHVLTVLASDPGNRRGSAELRVSVEPDPDLPADEWIADLAGTIDLIVSGDEEDVNCSAALHLHVDESADQQLEGEATCADERIGVIGVGGSVGTTVDGQLSLSFDGVPAIGAFVGSRTTSGIDFTFDFTVDDSTGAPWQVAGSATTTEVE